MQPGGFRRVCRAIIAMLQNEFRNAINL